jgi:hypothetical protein
MYPVMVEAKPLSIPITSGSDVPGVNVADEVPLPFATPFV